MKDVICVIPGGGVRNAGTSALLERLHVRDYCASYIVTSSAVTTLLMHLLAADGVAENVWKHVVPLKKYWSAWNVLKLHPVSDTEGLINTIFHALPMERFDEISARIYVSVYDVTAGNTEYIEMTKENARDLALASCYLPFLSHVPFRKRNVAIASKQYVDGSVRDIIPLEHIDRVGCRNVLFIANFPYRWLPDPVPFLLRMLASLTQPYGKRLSMHLHERTALYARKRRELEQRHARQQIHLCVLGPQSPTDRYPLEGPTDRLGICRTMQQARDLADRDREMFEHWISLVPNRPTL